MLTPDPGMRKGMPVRVRLEGTEDEWVRGVVLLASENGASVAIGLDGMVRAGGGYAGGVLLIDIDYDAETVTSLMGDRYEIEVADTAEGPIQ